MLIPVYNRGDILPTFFKFLYQLNPQPDLYVFAENNSSDDTLKKLQEFKLPHKIIRVWFRKDAAMLSINRYIPIAHIRQLLLTFARDYDSDYAIFLDSDVFPQTKELIKSLTSWNKDVVGGAYMRKFPSGIGLASKWKDPNKGYMLRQKAHLPLEEPEVTSAGCLCLSRKIIQDKRVNFYPVRIYASEDFGYCLQAREHGYQIFLDSITQLRHAFHANNTTKAWTRNVLTGRYEQFFYETKEQVDLKDCNKKLKIGLLSTRFFTLPPASYSGIEQVVWDLACALDTLGHEVILYAPKGSKPTPNGKVVEIGEPLRSCKINWLQTELESYDFFRDKLENLDILHGHNHYGIEYLGKIRNPELPVIHTHHGLNIGFLNMFKPVFRLNLASISDWTKQAFAQQGFVARRCYNGIDLDKYPFQAEKNDRLMFLGRISRSKGPHLAIKAAREAGVGLDIVGATSFVDDVDYVNEVKKLCDGKQVKFIGEVNHKTKIEYLQNASGILIPSNFGEPFGLISVEAMACGTVPIALNDGALKEIIKDGQTGFICNSIDQMASRIKEIELIDPKACRKRAQHFSKEKMAKEYVKLYTQIINGQEW